MNHLLYALSLFAASWAFALGEAKTHKTFVEYCEDQNLPAEQREFVNAVLEVFDTQDCAYAQAEAQNTGSLQLRARDLTDITPIMGFGQLVFIDLSWNRIKDFSPIAKLDGVRGLAVRYNGLTEIDSLLGIAELTHLDLTANRIRGLQGIEALSGLADLKIGEMHIHDLSPITKVKGLQALEVGFANSYLGSACDSPELTSRGLLENIAALKQLRTLKATRMGITSTAKIEALPQLQVLDLSCNAISETDVFNTLPNLREVYLAHNKLKEMTLSSTNSTISKLGLRGNQLTDSSVSALAKLERMHQLDLDGNQISDVSFVKGMPRLALFRIVGNRVSDISPLYDRSGLVQLVADSNAIEAVDFARFVAPVLDLQFNDNRISTLVGVDQLSEIESLGIGGNPIRDLSPINSIRPLVTCMSLNLSRLGLTDLSVLNQDNVCQLTLDGNRIARVDQLPQSQKLYALSLKHNKLSKLDGLLERLPRLSKLNLEGNPVDSLKPLAESEMSVLNVSRTMVRDLKEMSGIYGLNELYIAGLELTTLAPIEGYDLRVLDASANRITDLKPLRSQYYRLSYLDLRENRIASVAPIKDLRLLRFARSLKIRGNPLGSEIAKTSQNCPVDGLSHGVSVWCSSSAR